MKRLLQILGVCNECRLCVAWEMGGVPMRLDGVASAHCKFPGKHRALPANGKAPTKLRKMPIPDWCPLPDATDAEVAEAAEEDKDREAEAYGQQTSETSSPAERA